MSIDDPSDRSQFIPSSDQPVSSPWDENMDLGPTDRTIKSWTDTLVFDFIHTPEESIPYLIDLFSQGQIEMPEFEERVKRLL